MPSDDPDPTHVPTHAWWPAGCPVGRVRDCAEGGCEACERLLTRHRAVVAGRPVTAAGDASLAHFGGERA